MKLEGHLAITPPPGDGVGLHCLSDVAVTTGDLEVSVVNIGGIEYRNFVDGEINKAGWINSTLKEPVRVPVNTFAGGVVELGPCALVVPSPAAIAVPVPGFKKFTPLTSYVTLGVDYRDTAPLPVLDSSLDDQLVIRFLKPMSLHQRELRVVWVYHFFEKEPQ